MMIDNAQESPAEGERERSPLPTPLTTNTIAEWAVDELDALAGAVAEKIAALKKSSGELTSTVAGICAAVRKLDERVTALEPADGPAQDEVEAWVEGWLIPTFALTQELDGWDTQPGYRVLLTGLHDAWNHANSQKADGFARSSWGIYHLPGAIREIAALRARVSKEHHALNGTSSDVSRLLASINGDRP